MRLLEQLVTTIKQDEARQEAQRVRRRIVLDRGWLTASITQAGRKLEQIEALTYQDGKQ